MALRSGQGGRFELADGADDAAARSSAVAEPVGITTLLGKLPMSKPMIYLLSDWMCLAQAIPPYF